MLLPDQPSPTPDQTEASYVTVTGWSGLKDLPFALTLSNGLTGEGQLGDRPAPAPALSVALKGGGLVLWERAWASGGTVTGPDDCTGVVYQAALRSLPATGPQHSCVCSQPGRTTCASCRKIHVGRWPAGAGTQGFHCEIPQRGFACPPSLTDRVPCASTWGRRLPRTPKAAEGEDALETALECGPGLPPTLQQVPEPREAEFSSAPVGTGTTPWLSLSQPWWPGPQSTSGCLPWNVVHMRDRLAV